MKALVVGGAGFIGSHLTDQLIEQGHQVVIVDDLSTGREELIHTDATFHHFDIRSKSVADIFTQHQFDVVFHLAAQLDVRKSVADPIFDADINIIGTLNLLNLSVKAGVKKFIFSSTGGAVYGEQECFPADENHPLQPVSPYGVAKMTVEKYLYYYQHAYGLQTIALRYSNVYGPRQNSHGEAGVVAIFCQRLLEGKGLTIFGDGGQTRDYVSVFDVVSANIKALTSDFTGNINIGTGVETSLNELVEFIKKATDKTVTVTYEDGKPGEQYRSCLDNAKAGRIFGWQPAIPLVEGLKETVDSFLADSY